MSLKHKIPLGIFSLLTIPTTAILTTVSCKSSDDVAPTTTEDSSIDEPADNNSAYVVITFSSSDPDVTIVGNTTIQIKAGKVFGIIEKPTATKTDCNFLGWSPDNKKENILKDDSIITTNLNLQPIFEQVVPPEPIVLKNCVNFYANEDGYILGNSQTSGKFSYSSDGENWYDLSGPIKIKKYESIHLKGYNPLGFSSSETNYVTLSLLGNYSLSGSVMGLLDNATGTMNYLPGSYCFYRLFATDPQSPTISSVSADFLPATELCSYCYFEMFKNQSLLGSAPVLPAITLNEYCYEGMFDGCTSLVSAPSLPATTLADYCYESMFSGCSSLITPPELPATALSSHCYESMFSGCSSLITPPELPCENVHLNNPYCYKSMFSGCTSLTSAPSLPATTLSSSCYYGMFSGCTSLTVFYSLPATTLPSSCYRGMFSGCTSLTVAPTISATAFSGYCCESMFKDCYFLKVNTSPTGGTKIFTTPSPLPSGVFDDMFLNTRSSPTVSAGTTYYWH